MSGSEKLSEIVVRNDDKIKSAVLADHIMIGKMGGFTKEWNINGENVMLGVAR